MLATTTKANKSFNESRSYHHSNYASPPDYVFGVSTGHAGSVTTHDALFHANCSWGTPKGYIERRAPGEQTEKYNSASVDEDPCSYTKNTLIPFLDDQRKNHAWLDLGHYHNRLPSGLECLAHELGSRVAFVRVRRNRFDIAASFGATTDTPCLQNAHNSRVPMESYCPLNTEWHGPTALPLKNPKMWESFTTFQKFLWVTDELELRYQMMKRKYPTSRYYEVTWSSGNELTRGLQQVALDLADCSGGPLNDTLTNRNSHVSHKKGQRNCTQQILQDVRYRRLVLTEEQTSIVFQHSLQRVGGRVCRETNEELKNVLLAVGARLEDWEFVRE